MSVRLLALCVIAIVLASPAAGAQSRRVPTPASVIGFEPGTDKKLPEWQQVVAYFKALDAASPRVQLRVLGKTTLGRPFIAAFISDASNLAGLLRFERDRQFPSTAGCIAAIAGSSAGLGAPLPAFA